MNPKIGPVTQAAIDKAARSVASALVIDSLKKQLAINPEWRQIVRDQVIAMCNGDEGALNWLTQDGLPWSIAFVRFLEEGKK